MTMQRFLRLAVLSAAGMLPVPGFAEDAKPAQKNPQDLFQELDKNKDGKLTADEVSDEQRKFFDHLRRVADADKNGELTKDEFLKGFKPDESPGINPQGFGGRGEGQPQFDPKQQFERLDTNKDGKLTLEELPEQAKERLKPLFDRLGKTELSRDDYVQAIERSRRAFGGEGGPGEFFKRLDANKDGKLTLEEMPEQAQERFKPLFERLGKKELTQEEFAQAGPRFGGNPGEMFKRLDANNDGKLTLDELPEPAKERLKPLFERLGKKELTQEDFAQIGGRFRGEGGEGNPAETFKKLDANSDGKLTRDEIPESGRPQFDKLLERAGKGQDGALSHDEFVKFGGQDRGEAQARRPEGAPDGEKRPGREGGRPEGFPGPEELFKRWDANGDGKVTLDEVPDRARPLVERMLERAGKGRDGSLTLDDVKKFPPPPPARRAEGAPGDEGGRRPEGAQRGEGPGGNSLFRKIDTNGDGRLSKEELTKAADHFDELDLNKDGQLDPREIFGQGPGGPRGAAGREGPPPPREGARGDGPPRDGQPRDGKPREGKGRDEPEKRREKGAEERKRDSGEREKASGDKDKPREQN